MNRLDPTRRDWLKTVGAGVVPLALGGVLALPRPARRWRAPASLRRCWTP